LRFFQQPHDHQKKVAKFYYATPDLVTKAIEASLEAKAAWNKVAIEDRMKLFLNVADLVRNSTGEVTHFPVTYTLSSNIIHFAVTLQ
jgi:acyl-CoA reductase-like NAD-dependent aldehyde dehydrogenase